MSLSLRTSSTASAVGGHPLRSSPREALVNGILVTAGLGLAVVLIIGLGHGARLHAPNLGLLRVQPVVILAHAGAATLALLIGAGLMWGPKGTWAHRVFGWGWVVAMAVVVVSSFLFPLLIKSAISPIHGLSAFVALALPAAVMAAKRKEIAAHRKTMTGIFLFGLIVAGSFTFIPGRLMWRVFFG